MQYSWPRVALLLQALPVLVMPLHNWRRDKVLPLDITKGSGMQKKGPNESVIMAITFKQMEVQMFEKKHIPVAC